MLSNLLNQTVTAYPKTGLDDYGRTKTNGSVDYPARVTEVTRRILLPNGETVTIDALVIIDSNPDVDVEDRLDYNGTKYKVAGKKVAIDGQGETHHITFQCMKYKEGANG